MRTIINPWAGQAGYNCFGCAPHNAIGLGMQFSEDGDDIVSLWPVDERYAGFKGVLHGGIQATLHDEIASWVVFIKLKTAGYTEELNVRYLSPVYVKNSPLTLRARLATSSDKRATLSTVLYDATGKACSESTASYAIVPAHIASRMFAYPGIEAFFASAPAD